MAYHYVWKEGLKSVTKASVLRNEKKKKKRQVKPKIKRKRKQ